MNVIGKNQNESSGESGTNLESLTSLTEEEMRRNPAFIPGLVSLIDYLNHGIEKKPGWGEQHEIDFVYHFALRLKELIASAGLPYLLQQLARLLDHISPSQCEKPDLSNLFEMPWKKAKDFFDFFYLEFYKERSPADIMAATGLSKGNFAQNQQRARKKKEKWGN